MGRFRLFARPTDQPRWTPGRPGAPGLGAAPGRPRHPEASPARRATAPEPVTDPIGFPAVDVPGVDVPGVDVRGVDVRGVDVRGVGLPGVDGSAVDVPAVGVPAAGVSAFDVSAVDRIAPLPRPPALPVQSRGPDARTAPGADLAEVRALAAAFAADYLSWDEDDPTRRGDVLAEHLPARLRDLTRGTTGPGWAGEGRQRAEISLAGAVGSDDDGRLLVDVRVRVTPYVRAGRSAAAPQLVDVVRREPVLGRPSSAPPPDGVGWTGRRASWVRVSVPVTHDEGRLVVEPDEELLAPTGHVTRAEGGAS
ncbi:hypothetical protein PSU4_51510 [Pseudonocardia sulfidoxydans NBRC 16205]|uniref:Pentapeptide repeat-containing protein n=1 Tax=Pseudonocardia sulfidoxydans NBRC 16205 TaxID=1223511 RepID=A0A511DPA4_9PSEU|nr:hypothetical protein [Pseudonocardia sulfidoxydans]GEL26197.1 hypothetical protein PSU4_51510 [Pseudonocardia sulfidoxydans NBRC 16205]